MTDILHDKQKFIYKKNERYINERKKIVALLFIIIGITDKNNIFYSHQITTEQQKQIMNLKNDIEKYFKTSSWAVYRNSKKEVNKPYLSLIRCVMRDMGIKYTCANKKIRDINDVYVTTTIYVINQ